LKRLFNFRTLNSEGADGERLVDTLLAHILEPELELALDKIDISESEWEDDDDDEEDEDEEEDDEEDDDEEEEEEVDDDVEVQETLSSLLSSFTVTLSSVEELNFRSGGKSQIILDW